MTRQAGRMPALHGTQPMRTLLRSNVMFRALIAMVVKLAKVLAGKWLVRFVEVVWGLFLKLIKLLTRRRAFTSFALGRC